MNVTIDKHYAVHLRTKEEIYLHQHQVKVEGRLVAYLGHTTPPNLIFIAETSEAEFAAITKRVKAFTGHEPRVIGRAPDIPAEWIAEENDEEEEDEDDEDHDE